MIKTRIGKQDEKKLPVLIHELDRLVSEVVRRSNSDASGNCTCISCSAKGHWSDFDCAHFIDRGNMNTRFNLINLAPACRYCNRHDEDFHKEAWAKKLGPEIVATLEREGKSLRKLFRFELEQGIELMNRKLLELK